MRRFTQAKNILFFAVLSFVSFNSIAHDTETDEADLLNKYQQQLHFIQNKGQWDDNDIYRAQTFASTVQIRKDGFLLSVIDQQKLIESYELENEMEEADAKHLPRPNRSVVIPQHAWMVRFLGMNKAAKIESKFQDKTYYNYFIGNDKSKWASSVNSYEEVWYKNVYTNIDARLYAAEDLSLEYDMIVRPGANVADIKLAYEGLHGMYINKEGQLCIKTIFGESVYPKPIAYQLKGGKRVSVKCEYTVAKGEILGFEMGEYDKLAPLVIDPIALKWAVYVAYQSTTGSGHNHGIEVDQDQDLYVVGRLSSTNFPTTAGVFQTTATGTNTHGFVAKMSVPNGVNGAGNFIWATYVSGTTAGDNPYSIKLDAAKNSYITGVTASTNFPTTAGAYDVTHNGGNDGFVTKLNSTGTALLYSTFIGSAGMDESNFLYVTPTNEVWIAGRTTNAAFPITAGAIDATFAGAGEAFLAKFNATGTSLLYSTFYGGAGDDAFVCLRPSGVNELIAIGTTSSDNTGNAIATAGAFQTTRSGTALNGMLMKFNTSTNTRTWGTYINPTAGGDLTLTCGQVDNGGNIYFGGHTPGVVAACITAGVYDASFNGGGRDFYLGKINAAGSSLLAGTYIGGNAAETNLMGLNIDDFGKVYAFGYTNSSSPSLSTTSNPLQAANNGGQDAIFFKISSDYSTMEYLSYWGGSNDETDPIGFDGIKFSECKAYTAMTTQSANAPMTRNGFQINKTSGTIQEPAVTVWSNPPDVDVDTITGNENVCYGTAPLLDINGSASTYITSDISRAGVVTPHPGLGTLTYSWSKSTDSINFTVIPAATGQNLTVAEIGVLTQTTHFKRNIASDFCKGGVIVTKKVVNIAIPDGTESNGGIVCRGATINLTATGETGATFNWTGPNSFSATGANQTISNAQLVNQGDYYVTQTVAGCTSPPDTVAVSIINCPPVAINDAYSVNEDQVLSDDVTTNDSDPNGDPLTITLDNGNTATANGTLVLNNDGTFTYTPNPNFNGVVSFTYSACDNGVPLPVLCDTATVTITVNSVNDVPTAEADDTTVPEDGSVTVPVLSNDTFGGDGPSTGTISIVTPPTNGTATVNDGGTPNDPTDDQIDYTPNPNYNGADNIIYEICDANGDCDTAIVNITVSPVNDVPTAEADDTTVPEDG
ncbi:MAG TPA: Ig-like domain-containing protein, partial [Chitinophagales bacterium]|nr:Ig-like domain-containing protein [Chitinophagales bacterium]